jgi:hypothetical protein
LLIEIQKRSRAQGVHARCRRARSRCTPCSGMERRRRGPSHAFVLVVIIHSGHISCLCAVDTRHSFLRTRRSAAAAACTVSGSRWVAWSWCSSTSTSAETRTPARLSGNVASAMARLFANRWLTVKHIGPARAHVLAGCCRAFGLRQG